MVNKASPHVDKKKAVKLSKSKGRLIGYPKVAASRKWNIGNVTRRHMTGKPKGYAQGYRDIDDIIKDMERKERQSARHHKR